MSRLLSHSNAWPLILSIRVVIPNINKVTTIKNTTSLKMTLEIDINFQLQLCFFVWSNLNCKSKLFLFIGLHFEFLNVRVGIKYIRIG